MKKQSLDGGLHQIIWSFGGHLDVDKGENKASILPLQIVPLIATEISANF